MPQRREQPATHASGAALPAGLALALVFAPAALAQPSPLQESVRAGHLGSAFQAFSIFGGTPGISAATYDAGELAIDSYKLPLARSFEPFTNGLLAGTAPYAELTLGYLHAAQDGDPGLGLGRMELRFDAVTALAGAGLDILLPLPVGGSTVLRPILLGGYSRIEADLRFTDPAGAPLEQAMRGVLSGVRIESLLLGGALAVQHRREVAPRTHLTATLRYNYLADAAQNASDPALQERGDFGVASAAAELSGPTGLGVGHYALRWLGFTSGVLMLGPSREALGFSSFAELGGGLQLTDPARPGGLFGGIDAAGLRGSAIVGSGVTGWSLGLSVTF